MIFLEGPVRQRARTSRKGRITPAPAGQCASDSPRRSAIDGGFAFIVRPASRQRLELRDQFAVVGKLARFVLAVDERAVHGNVKNASGTLDQLGGNAELLLDLFRQTGGSREIVSHPTVLDRHLHVKPPDSEAHNGTLRPARARGARPDP